MPYPLAATKRRATEDERKAAFTKTPSGLRGRWSALSYCVHPTIAFPKEVESMRIPTQASSLTPN